MIKGADFQAFLLPQHELMGKTGFLTVDPAVELDACLVTSVPPYAKKVVEIIKEHLWFCGVLARQVERVPTCFYGIQHPPEDATAANLLKLKGLGIRFMTLAYEMESVYGGGFAVPDAPLTKRGEQFLEDMSATGIVLDLSHAGHQTARDALKYIRTHNLSLRVVATHTACHAVYGHKRNLPDDVLAGVADRGGIVGIVTGTWMLDAEDNLFQPFMAHVMHAVNLLGPRHVAVGSDGVYQKLDADEEQKLFAAMKEKIDARGNFNARYPEHPVERNGPDRMSVIAQKLLVHPGLSLATVKAVAGENLLRYFSEL
ncbi:MAG: membrane dipeptidase [Patescibacteria group bacterium]